MILLANVSGFLFAAALMLLDSFEVPYMMRNFVLIPMILAATVYLHEKMAEAAKVPHARFSNYAVILAVSALWYCTITNIYHLVADKNADTLLVLVALIVVVYVIYHALGEEEPEHRQPFVKMSLTNYPALWLDAGLIFICLRYQVADKLPLADILLTWAIGLCLFGAFINMVVTYRNKPTAYYRRIDM